MKTHEASALAFETRRIESVGVTTHLELAGHADGAPVLFLHGNPDSAELWHPVIRQLDQQSLGLRYLAPDLPGFGRSGSAAGYVAELSREPLETMAAWVDGVVAEALPDRGPLHLVVHDFGGPYGFAWAVRNPDRIRSLTAIDTLFFAEYRWHFWARVWRSPVLGELSLRLFSWPVFRWEMHRGSPSLDRATLRATWKYVTPSMKRMVLDLYRATDPEVFVGWEEQLRALMAERPSLALWGADDPYIAPEWAHRLGARRVEVLPDLGHWLPLEAPALVTEHLARLLAPRTEP